MASSVVVEIDPAIFEYSHDSNLSGDTIYSARSLNVPEEGNVSDELEDDVQLIDEASVQLIDDDSVQLIVDDDSVQLIVDDDSVQLIDDINKELHDDASRELKDVVSKEVKVNISEAVKDDVREEVKDDTSKELKDYASEEPNDDFREEFKYDQENSAEGVVTDKMIAEEAKIKEDLKRKEKEEEIAFKKKVTASEKERSFKRLLKLLSRSQLYATYLKEKMRVQQEMNDHQEGKTASKKKSKVSQTENVNQSSVPRIQTRGLNNLSGSGRQKRGQPWDSQESKSIVKRKKLEDVKLNETKVPDVNEEEEEEDDVAELEDEKDAVILSDEQRQEFARNISARQPELLVGGVMRDYQLDGFEWMKVLYENGINGILADEMGLGKTIQCISLLAHLVDKGVTGPYLIVAPLSTLPNWYAEFKRFAPQIPVVLYHGLKEERLLLKKKLNRNVPVRDSLKSKPVVITSYQIVINDVTILRKFCWRYLIVDEGHRLKNYNSILCMNLRTFATSNRLILTGTPLQNNLSELWSLLNFLLPEIFDNLGVFESWFDVKAMSTNECDESIIAQEQEKHIISTLHEILKPFLLRRTKADVDLKLPLKKEVMVYAPLTSLQQLFYKATLDKTIQNLLLERCGGAIRKTPVLEVSGKRSCVKKIDYAVFGRDLTREELIILDEWDKQKCPKPEVPEPPKMVMKLSTDVRLNARNILPPLRKICNHPYLLEYPLDPETGTHKIDENLVTVCGKLQLLDIMLPALKNRGHKVLLFSQMTSLLNVIEDYCEIRDHSYVRLDGSVHLRHREELIRSFNTDPNIFLFLISTRAGGLGINLTAADTVIIYDSDWNPQCDLQAQDRCHRFGQTKPVVVYRLVTANTIDEKIVIRAAAKRRLEKMIMKKGHFSKYLDDTTQTGNSAFSVEELKELLSSTDHSGIVHTDSSKLLTAEQLEMLLDRGDLIPKDDPTNFTVPDQEGVFKVIDHDADVELSVDVNT